jgi:electron transfer flavoprotein beta subunit
VDGSASGFTDPVEVAGALAGAVERIPSLDRSRLLLFGGCASASRDAGVTVQMVGERLGITDQFLSADELTVSPDGTLTILERVEGGRYLVSDVAGPPCAIAWATGNLPEPPNNPQVGMMNMRTIMPALQKAPAFQFGSQETVFQSVALPKQERRTRIVKDVPIDEMAREIADWIKG